MERIDPGFSGDELTMLCEYLDYHRATLHNKASGLDRAAMGTRIPTTELTLAGLVKHAALNEGHWFGVVLRGQPAPDWYAHVAWEDDPDWEFRTALDQEPEDLLALYAAACDRSRANIAEAAAEGGLDTRSVGLSRRTGEQFTLRWILLHMLEETARHNGHADLLREATDGQTGE